MLGWGKVIDTSVFMQAIDHDTNMIETVIELFKQQYSINMSTMQGALSKNDALAFERAAHDMKNIGRQIACDKLIKLSRSLEEVAETNNFEQAERLLRETQKTVDKALKELVALRNRA